MKAIDLREMTAEELGAVYEDASKEMFNLSLQLSLGQLEKPSRLRTVRRDIARIQTVLTERSKIEKGTVSDG